MLHVDALTVSFGAQQVFDELSFAAGGGVTALIGPNGAGKSTVVNAITGLLRPQRGTVSWRGQPLLGRSIDQIAELGVVRTFQSARLFPSLTALENVMVGAHRFVKSGLFATALGLPSARRSSAELRGRARDALTAVGCAHLGQQPAALLTAGQQRLVSVARAIAAHPELLVLDEPAAGLNDEETVMLARDLRALSEAGVSLLVIEHHMEFVMSLAAHVVVLADGGIVAAGTPSQVKSDDAVIRAYLGREDD